eukprot:2949266-Rhodomonas_salina.3
MQHTVRGAAHRWPLSPAQSSSGPAPTVAGISPVRKVATQGHDARTRRQSQREVRTKGHSERPSRKNTTRRRDQGRKASTSGRLQLGCVQQRAMHRSGIGTIASICVSAQQIARIG